ncbi:MAG TPA: hypothetical protein VMV72_19710 [Verrucomicrobiae bacterium]|nr:hypothetical protein [Verrucomicrobiae bacterium]
MSTRAIVGWSVFFGLLTILLRIPFLFRYDLYFQSGIAVPYLQCKRLMHGEFSIYCWATDYAGITPCEPLAALLFRVFGPSIPLVCFTGLFAWALGVAVLVGYIGRVYGRAAAVGSGVALTIEVPFLLMYNTQPMFTYSCMPLYIAGFVWLTAILVRRGPKSKVALLIGLLMGYMWYMNKQVLILWASIGLALLVLPQSRKFLASFLRSRMLWGMILAFVIGYMPEILYKMGCFDHEGRKGDTSSFFRVATPGLVARNWYMYFRCLPTYFNADPWSRTPENVHYLNHVEDWESYPRYPSDTVGILAAILVIGYGLRQLREAYRERRLETLLLGALPVADLLLILFAASADGSYYKIRRYILPAGVVFLVWWGLRLAEDWRARRWVTAGILALALLISLVQQYQMLAWPDDLADYRRTAEDIENHGHKYGLSFYSYAHTLTALSNERLQFGVIDHTVQNPYQRTVLEQPEVVFVWPYTTPPPMEFAQKLVFGQVLFQDATPRTFPKDLAVLGWLYTRIDEPHPNGELAWAVYRKVGTVGPPPGP